MIHQSSVRGIFAGANELPLTFVDPTGQNSVLVAAWTISRGAIQNTADNLGVAWRRASRSAWRGGQWLELWRREGGHKLYTLPPGALEGGHRIVPAAAGVTSVTATVAAGVLVSGSGLALECEVGTSAPDAVQMLSELIEGVA